VKIGRNIINFNIFSLIMVSKKVISNLYVLGLIMLICILGHMNCISIIKKYFYMIIIQIINEESMVYTNAQQAPTTTYSASAIEEGY